MIVLIENKKKHFCQCLFIYMKNYNIHKNKKYEIKKWTWKKSPSGCACRFNIRYIEHKLKKKI